MGPLPVRGAAVRDLDLAVPPDPMPPLRRGRLLKRWLYVGVYAPDLLLCVGDARIGPVPQRWWAFTGADRQLHQRTTLGPAGVTVTSRRVSVRSGEVAIELELDESEGLEIASPSGERDNYIWTRKHAGVPVRGAVSVGGRERRIDGPHAFIDASAGYHHRHTAWQWSAGLGRTGSGQAVGWNLVDGVHDAEERSERTLWVDGEPRELAAATFADDLSRVTTVDGVDLRFEEWATREASLNALLLRNTYRQPFGSFTGTLGDGLELAEGYGVMEDHDVWW